MAFFNEFPHTRTYDSDLGWLIWAMRKLIGDMEDFSNLNTIKFADPINWTIDRNYEATTIVLSPDGNGYISQKPVPAGVPLSNTDYWTQIFSFGDLSDQIRNNIALPNFNESPTATEAIEEGALLWWNNDLYEAMTDIPIGTAFVADGNIKKIILDDWIRAQLNNVSSQIEDIYNNVSTQIGDLRDQTDGLQTRIDNIEKYAYLDNVKKYGAVGDGSTDDSAAFQNAIDNTALGGIVIPVGTYLINSPLTITGKNGFIILGAGGKIVRNTNTTSGRLIQVYDSKHIIIKNLEVDGQRIYTGGENTDSRGELLFINSNNNNNFLAIEDVTVEDCYFHDWCGDGIFIGGPKANEGETAWDPIVKKIRIRNNVIKNVRVGIRNSVIGQSVIDGNEISYTYNETICVDNGCNDVIITNNNLHHAEGGVGTIGSNMSRGTIISNNRISGLGARYVSGKNYCALYINGVTDPRGNSGIATCVVVGNFISNYEYGIVAMSEAGEPTIGNSIFNSNRISNIVNDAIFLQMPSGTVRAYGNAVGTHSIQQYDMDNNVVINSDLFNDTNAIIYDMGDYLVSGATLAGGVNKFIKLGQYVLISGRVSGLTGTDVPAFNNIPRHLRPVYNFYGANCTVFSNGQISLQNPSVNFYAVYPINV